MGVTIIIYFLGNPWHFPDFWIFDPLKSPLGPLGWGEVRFKQIYWFSGQFMTFPGLLNVWPPKITPGVGWLKLFRFESVPYLSEYVCQIWLRSDGRECHASMTIAKCTKTAASSNDSNHLSRTPAAWFANSRVTWGMTAPGVRRSPSCRQFEATPHIYRIYRMVLPSAGYLFRKQHAVPHVRSTGNLSS